MPDDWTAQVRQIAQYPLATPGPNDVFLFQLGGVGGPYRSVTAPVLFQTALDMDGWLHLAPGAGIAWNGAALSYNAGLFNFSEPVAVPSLQSTGDIFVNGQALATQIYTTGLFDTLLENTVWSFNGRKGEVQLTTDDIRQAGGVPNENPSFFGTVTAPTPWNANACDNTVATTAFVQNAIINAGNNGTMVRSFNGRGGCVTLTADDITFALTQPGAFAMANNPPSGDASRRLATTYFVDDAMAELEQQVVDNTISIEEILNANYAPLNSPNFTGIPTAPTAAQTVNSGQLATTAFVHAAVTAATTGVSSFNTRTGAVTLLAADVTGVGGALLASPAFTGTPTAPTPLTGNNSTTLATTAFVAASITAGTVTSFNSRAGAVTLTIGDITGAGGAPLNNAALTGSPSAPTATAGTNTTQLATTAFVAAAVAASTAGVASFNGRTGTVTLNSSDVSAAGGALTASPALTGTPTAPTPPPGDNSTKIATTAFVLSSGGIPEAPQDSNAYGRRNAAWTQVIMSSGDIIDGGSF